MEREKAEKEAQQKEEHFKANQVMVQCVVSQWFLNTHGSHGVTMTIIVCGSRQQERLNFHLLDEYRWSSYCAI